jgi:ABC-type Fe3+ transport system substrate-binding protein
MHAINRALRAVSALAVVALFSPLAAAETVTVITSFPKELTKAYKAAFEKVHPGTTVEVLNKGTTSAIAYVRETPAGQRPDVFWASAPDAFAVLSGEKLLQPVAHLANKDAPAKIGAYPINDPQGFYLGQALAGYGLMWNTRYLAANRIPAPAEWADLTKPAYFNHVAVSAPSRSGTTHLTIETILQGEGWGKGWSEILQIAGNCAQITERSFGVPDGVNNGQFGIGLVIDFFGLSGKYSGFPVEFAYPTVTAVVPANIGLVAGGKNPEHGRKFIAFALSPQGQDILLLPSISRLPILPRDKMGGKVPAGYPDAFKVAERAKVQFDTALSKSRYYLVSILFDQTITFRHKELQAAAKAIHAAEAKLATKPNPPATALVKQARDMAFTPVLDEKAAGDPALLELFAKKKKQDPEVTKLLTERESAWNSLARANYEKAKQLADRAAAM